MARCSKQMKHPVFGGFVSKGSDEFEIEVEKAEFGNKVSVLGEN
jgi:hypothetical protein